VGSGSHRIAAAYGGDVEHAGSTGSLALAVGPTTTSAAVGCTRSVEVGRVALCSATVKATGGATGDPTGSVQLASDLPGMFPRGTSCALSATGSAGTASCVVRFVPLRSGNDGIAVRYAGDANDLASVAATRVRVARAASATTVACHPLAIATGRRTTCTATVTDRTSGAVTPRGLVRFRSAHGTFAHRGRCRLTPTRVAGVAACNLSYRPAPSSVGALTITARYLGSSSHRASRGSTLVDVRR
jgi:hypothetical protein